MGIDSSLRLTNPGVGARLRVPLLVMLMLGLAGEILAGQGPGRGAKSATEEPAGAQLAVGYAVDAFFLSGGGASREAVALDNLDLLLHVDLDALLGMPGSSLQIQVQSNRGNSVSSRVGDLQGVSNLEAPEGWRLYEAWVEQELGSPRLSLLAGVYDVNADFDVIPAAEVFLHSSFGFGPEYSLGGAPGPSTYPSTGLGARIRFEPIPDVYGLFGVSDGAPDSPGGLRFALDPEDGALLSFEVGYARTLSGGAPGIVRPRQPPGRGATVYRGFRRHQRRRIGRGRVIEEVSAKIALGGWMSTLEQDRWDGAIQERSWGFYLLGEHLLHQELDGTGELSGFLRVGTAAEAVNRLDLSLTGGLVYRGALRSRPDDVVGLGVAHARNGSPFLQAERGAGRPTERGETAIELTYSARIGRLFLLQPDLQWVVNPGMDPTRRDALLFGLRGHVRLEVPNS